MQQTMRLPMTMPLDKITPYAHVQKGETIELPTKGQTIQVLSGIAWLSLQGDDYILEAGQALTLERGGDNRAFVGTLKGTTVKYCIR